MTLYCFVFQHTRCLTSSQEYPQAASTSNDVLSRGFTNMRLATKVTMTLYCTSYDSVRHAAMHALNFVDAYHCCENGNDMVCVLIQTRTSVWQKSSDEASWRKPRSTLPFFPPCQHCLTRSSIAGEQALELAPRRQWAVPSRLLCFHRRRMLWSRIKYDNDIVTIYSVMNNGGWTPCRKLCTSWC